jgi:hypothetical protein
MENVVARVVGLVGAALADAQDFVFGLATRVFTKLRVRAKLLDTPMSAAWECVRLRGRGTELSKSSESGNPNLKRVLSGGCRIVSLIVDGSMK